MAKIERNIDMLLENNTKNVVNLFKLYEEFHKEKKLILLINLFENLKFKTDFETKNIVSLLKRVLEKINQNYNKTIINFSKYKELLCFSSMYFELSNAEKKKLIIEMLFDIYNTNFEDEFINEYINNNLNVYDYYYSLVN